MSEPRTAPWSAAFAAADRWVGRLSQVLAVAGALAAGVIMVTMCADVFVRLTQDRSLPGAFELVETLLVVAVFLTLPYGERSRSHVRVELLGSVLPVRASGVTRTLGNIVATGVCAWLAKASIESAERSISIREFTSGIVDFPVYPARVCVAVGFAVLTLELAFSTGRSWHQARTGQREQLETEASATAGA